MDQEDSNRIFVLYNRRHDEAKLTISTKTSNGSSDSNDGKQVENKTRAYSYSDFKQSGILNMYQNSTVPLKLDCLKLGLQDDDTEGAEKVASDCHNTVSRFRKGRGSSLLGTTRPTNASAVIRRRQQRRHRGRGRNGSYLKYLRFVLSIMYYMGVSPYRPRSTRSLPKPLAFLLQVSHWGFISIVILGSVSQLKMRWIAFRVTPKILPIAEIGISIVALLTRIYMVKVFGALKKMKTDPFLDANSETNTTRADDTTPEYTFKVTALMLLTLSIGMAIASVTFGFVPLKNWSFGLQQRIVAYETNECIAVWSPTNWENVTDKLLTQYTVEISTPMVSFAIVGDTVGYVGNLYDNLMVDFWLALSYQVYSQQQDLGRFLADADILNTLDFDFGWNMYMESRAACDCIDRIFGPLMKLVHVSNIFRLSEFLLDIMQNDLSAMRVIGFINLLKILGTFYFCLLSAEMNGKMQELVVNRADTMGLVEVNGVKVKLSTLRTEMKHHQIGLGRGNFHVEETFLIKILCAAWSVFALFADNSPGRE